MTMGRLRGASAGVTLLEFLIGASILALAITSLLDVVARHLALNMHMRNLSWAAIDASRVMERIRQQNVGDACANPSVAPPAPFLDWDAWLAADTGAGGAGGKSLQVNPAANELVAISPSGANPIEVTVAICWRDHQSRVLGECQWNGVQLIPNDANGDGVISGLAMLSTLVTCR